MKPFEVRVHKRLYMSVRWKSRQNNSVRKAVALPPDVPSVSDRRTWTSVLLQPDETGQVLTGSHWFSLLASTMRAECWTFDRPPKGALPPELSSYELPSIDADITEPIALSDSHGNIKQAPLASLEGCGESCALES